MKRTENVYLFSDFLSSVFFFFLFQTNIESFPRKILPKLWQKQHNAALFCFSKNANELKLELVALLIHMCWEAPRCKISFIINESKAHNRFIRWLLMPLKMMNCDSTTVTIRHSSDFIFLFNWHLTRLYRHF